MATVSGFTLIKRSFECPFFLLLLAPLINPVEFKLFPSLVVVAVVAVVTAVPSSPILRFFVTWQKVSCSPALTQFTSTEGLLFPPRDESELEESDDSLFSISFGASFVTTGAFPFFLLVTWLPSESEAELEELADERVWLECFSLALVLTSFFLTDFAFCEGESLDSSSSNFKL